MSNADFGMGSASWVPTIRYICRRRDLSLATLGFPSLNGRFSRIGRPKIFGAYREACWERPRSEGLRFPLQMHQGGAIRWVAYVIATT